MTIQLSETQRNSLLARAPRGPIVLLYAYTQAPSTTVTSSPARTHLRSARFLRNMIGTATPSWSAFRMDLYASSDAALADLQARLGETGLERVIALRPPAAKVMRSIKVLQFGLNLLPKPAWDATPPSSLYDDPRNPDQAAMTWLEESAEGPLDMLNFLKFNQPDGQSDYFRYGKVAMQTIFRQGGELLQMGRYLLTVASHDGAAHSELWDEIAIMRYPKAAAFLRMVHNQRYLAALSHRDRGLAHTWLIATQAIPARGGQ